MIFCALVFAADIFSAALESDEAEAKSLRKKEDWGGNELVLLFLFLLVLDARDNGRVVVVVGKGKWWRRRSKGERVTI